MTEDEIPCSDPHICQADSLAQASVPMPRIFDLILRFVEKCRREGAWRATGKALQVIFRGSAPCAPSRKAPSRHLLRREEEVLDLQPGEWVEVKPVHDILSTLDSEGKLRGLAFLPGMYPFCGRQFQVLRRMETLYQEESGKVRCLKNTVLLADVQCDGLLMKCDRLCYLFWREAWLKRAVHAQN